MKKLLYVVDYLQNEPNSVGIILNVMLAELQVWGGGVKQMVVKVRGNQENTYIYDDIDGYKTYTARSYTGISSLAIRAKRKFFGVRGQKECNISHISTIIDLEHPDLVVFFVFSPDEDYTRVCQDRNIPYIYMLYDTYAGRPGIDAEKARQIEKIVIDSSVAYFVPGFFYNEYKQYSSEKVIPFDLPLLIQKDKVKAAFSRNAEKYNFSYFGQIQNFRNAERIKDICRQLNIKLDVFPSMPVERDDVFIVHEPVSEDALYDAVCHSKFLIAFDNSAPYDRYLPSKAYLYASFTKPIIAFGDNKESALLGFFSEYPYFYYQNINESIDGLIEFIQLAWKSEFNESLYNRFTKFTPAIALDGVKETISKFLLD